MPTFLVWPDGSYMDEDDYNCYKHGGKGDNFYTVDAEDEDELEEILGDELG